MKYNSHDKEQEVEAIRMTKGRKTTFEERVESFNIT